MLAQPASSQAAAKTIISGFNSKLDAKITAFKHSNCGVSALSLLIRILSNATGPMLGE